MSNYSMQPPMSLSMRIIFLLIGLIVFTSLAIGLPSIWAARSQLDNLAWELVYQGSQTTQALLEVQERELRDAAILTSQRPTLAALLEADTPAELSPYLETLRQGAAVDLLMICNLQGQPVVQAGIAAPAILCQEIPIQDTVWVIGNQKVEGAPGWFLVAQPVGRTSFQVIAGQMIDEAFIEQLSSQTDLEQAILFEGKILASSYDNSEMEWRKVEISPATHARFSEFDGEAGQFELSNGLHYALLTGSSLPGLQILSALPVNDWIVAQRRLTVNLLVVMAGVIAVCSLVGGLLTRRLSHPLGRLKDAALALRKGDLTTPVSVKTPVPEIAQVSYALEDARIALGHSMSELRREKAWTDHLLKSVVEGIVTLDRRRRVTYLSEGAERILGVKQEYVLGKAIDELLTVEGEKPFSEHIPSPGGGQAIVTIQSGSRLITLAITGAELAPPDAGKAHLALVLRDISNDQAVHRLLGDFLATITHEFRTPLTAQAVAIELLLDQMDDLSPAELRELLNAQHLGVLSLQNLIDNLLEGASIETGRFKVSPEPVDLAALVEQVTESMMPLISKYDLRLQTEVPENMPAVHADPRRTGQVLVNLLSNSIKWSPAGGSVLIRAEAESDQARVFVIDSGPGVSSEIKEKLFSRFTTLQSNRHDRAEYGAGLGLAVVKAIVEAQGGQVGVQDGGMGEGAPGGAIFWFTLPLHPSTSKIDVTERSSA
jgi:PAS domain S-box-containing protein